MNVINPQSTILNVLNINSFTTTDDTDSFFSSARITKHVLVYVTLQFFSQLLPSVLTAVKRNKDALGQNKAKSFKVTTVVSHC